MTLTATQAPRAGTLARTDAMQLAEAEYRRFIDLLRRLQPVDWTAPTDCPRWNVREVVAHTLGMIEMAASIREQVRQNRAAAARRAERGGLHLDALTALQVEERADMTPEQLLARIASRAPKAVRARRRIPGIDRRCKLPVAQQVGDTQETWTIGFLTDVILTRDVWMHRTDIARATGGPHVLTPAHDGAIVADVVLEWAARHGQPYTLRLIGPAGGEWSAGGGQGASVIDMDAVDFARALSGRGPAEGLLATAVPF